MATSFKKFTHDDWNRVEIKYTDPHMLAVLSTLCQLGDPTLQTVVESQLKVCGEDGYLEIIRPQLVSMGYVDPLMDTQPEQTDKKKKKKKKGKHNKGPSKKEEIIRQNTLRRIKQALDSTLETYTSRILQTTYGFRSSYAEIRIMTLMYAIHFSMQSKTKESSLYELAIGVAKTLERVVTIKGISQTACDDLRQLHAKFVNSFVFSYEAMFNRFPRLCLSTEYDKIFPSMAIKPYKSQTELIELLRNNDRCFIPYNAMIGSGKTTTSLALAKVVEAERKEIKANGKEPTLQLIFACSVEPVRHQVCTIAYNKDVPFGVATLEANGSVRVTNNYNCSKDENRLLIVADLESTLGLLKQSQNYILFLDEPTVGADTSNSPITEIVCEIVANAPARSILSSATLPQLDDIQELVQHFRERYPGAVADHVYSREAMIGCEMMTFDGETIAPHNNCTTCEELAFVVDQLKHQLFIDRLYTAPLVYRLCQRLHEHNIEAVNLETYFSDVRKLCQKEIQNVAIKMLEQVVATGDDSVVQAICEPFGKIIVEADITEEEDDDLDIVWETNDEIHEEKPYDFQKIFTTDAHRFTGSCLVTVAEPMSFAKEAADLLFKDCRSAKKIIERYLNATQKYGQEIERLSVGGGKSVIKNDDLRSKKEQSIAKPTLDFPNELRVNTEFHLQRYAPTLVDQIDKSLLQPLIALENIPMDMYVPDWVHLLLFAGIGIYQQDNTQLSSQYTDTVLHMASNGQLAFLISDDGICYGANYPFSHVIIHDDVADSHSISTLFQLAGRAGRVGTSWVAYAHVGQNTAQRLSDYIHGREGTGISMEAVNMVDAFVRVTAEKEEEPVKQVTATTKSTITVVSIGDIRRLSEAKPEPNPEPIPPPQTTDRYIPPNRRFTQPSKQEKPSNTWTTVGSNNRRDNNNRNNNYSSGGNWRR